MKRTSISTILPVLVFVSVRAAGGADFKVNPGDGSCPAGYRLASYEEAIAFREDACAVLGQWHIARIDGGSMDGPGHGCTARQKDDRALGHSLCIKGGEGTWRSDPDFADVTHGKVHEYYAWQGTFLKVDDQRACAAACRQAGDSCKGFSWYVEGDWQGDNCKLLPQSPSLDGSGRTATPQKTLHHYRRTSFPWDRELPGFVNVTHARVHEYYPGKGSFVRVADAGACAAACRQAGDGCKGFSWYAQGDYQGTNCKLLQTTPDLDGSGRLATPQKTLHHYARRVSKAGDVRVFFFEDRTEAARSTLAFLNEQLEQEARKRGITANELWLQSNQDSKLARLATDRKFPLPREMVGELGRTYGPDGPPEGLFGCYHRPTTWKRQSLGKPVYTEFWVDCYDGVDHEFTQDLVTHSWWNGETLLYMSESVPTCHEHADHAFEAEIAGDMRLTHIVLSISRAPSQAERDALQECNDERRRCSAILSMLSRSSQPFFGQETRDALQVCADRPCHHPGPREGSDALLIDEAYLEIGHSRSKMARIPKGWGQDGGKGYCLDAEERDLFGASADGCDQTLKFEYGTFEVAPLDEPPDFELAGAYRDEIRIGGCGGSADVLEEILIPCNHDVVECTRLEGLDLVFDEVRDVRYEVLGARLGKMMENPRFWIGKDGLLTKLAESYIPGAGLITAIVHADAGNAEHARRAAVSGAISSASTIGIAATGGASMVAVGGIAFTGGAGEYLAQTALANDDPRVEEALAAGLLGVAGEFSPDGGIIIDAAGFEDLVGD